MASSRGLAWGLATAVGLAAGLAGYVSHAALVNHTPKQEVRVQRLTEMVGLEESPAISPDGKWVAFVATTGGRRQIWVRTLANGALRQITTENMDHYEPRWAPDSASLIYYTAGEEKGPGVIWEIPAAGGSARRVIDSFCPGDLSHDGKNLAFIRVNHGAEFAVLARDGSGTRTVTNLTGGGLYSNLRWSPDDQSLALLQDHVDRRPPNTLIVASVSTGELRKVSEHALLSGFTWIPDGSGLIVSSAEGSPMADPPTYNLRYIPRGNGLSAQITFGEDSYESPDMGAMGNLVVSRVRTRSDIWKFPVTGDPAENVRQGVRITRQTGRAESVTVSPDESEVAFLSDYGGHANVWVARISDGEMHMVTHESDPNVIIGAPTWQPQGDGIYFTRSGTMWLAKPDGSNTRRASEIGFQSDLRPSASPDGKWVAVPIRNGSTDNLWALPIFGGEKKQLTDFGTRNVMISPQIAWSKDGKYLYAAVSDIDSDIVMLSGLKWR